MANRGSEASRYGGMVSSRVDEYIDDLRARVEAVEARVSGG